MCYKRMGTVPIYFTLMLYKTGHLIVYGDTSLFSDIVGRSHHNGHSLAHEFSCIFLSPSESESLIL